LTFISTSVKLVAVSQTHKPIRLSQHAREQLVFRGCNEEEIKETIRAANWGAAELNRLDCRKNFAFNKIWNNKFYTAKQIRPIFVEEEKEIVVITVYVYYIA